MCGEYLQIIVGEEAFVGFSEKNLLLPLGAQDEGASRHEMYYQNLVTEKENEGRSRQDTLTSSECAARPNSQHTSFLPVQHHPDGNQPCRPYLDLFLATLLLGYLPGQSQLLGSKLPDVILAPAAFSL